MRGGKLLSQKYRQEIFLVSDITFLLHLVDPVSLFITFLTTKTFKNKKSKSFKKILWTAMSEERINNLMLLTIDKGWLDSINVIYIANKFSDCNYERNQFWYI